MIINSTIAKRFLSVFLFSTCFISLVFGQQKVQNLNRNQEWSFEENKGQLLTETGKPANDIKYYGKQGGVGIFCAKGKIYFNLQLPKKKQQFSEATGIIPKNNEDAEMQFITMEMEFSGANNDAEIIANDEQIFYKNYYLPHVQEGIITNTYKKIIYKDIYPNIDLIIKALPGSIKYEFAVFQGGNYKDIKIKWKGTDKIEKLANGDLNYFGSSVILNESKPVSYYAGTKQKIATEFNLSSGIVSFNVIGYKNQQDFIIDPVISWGTYLGGTSDDVGTKVITDNSGNIYVSGYTSSSLFISTSGAFQTTIGGYTDAYITKFSNSGSRLWSSYYGGSGNDYAYGVAMDASGNIYITGSTTSSSGLATSGAFQVTNGGYGYADAFIAKFSNSGSRIWGTYFGGSDNEKATGIAIDGYNNIYIAGNTRSYSGIASSNCYQTTLGSGTYDDAFVAKFSASGSRLWSTYYGGNQNDEATGITTDPGGNVLITGRTKSPASIMTTGFAIQKTLGGYYDGFIAKFNGNGFRRWSTYYGGENDDIVMDVKTYNGYDIYVIGNTGSHYDIATNNAYQTSLSSFTDGFILKIDSTGSQKRWATYLGGNSNDNLNSLCIDNDGNLYLTGTTASSSTFASAAAYKTKNSLSYDLDAFVSKFDYKGGRIWSTYYGGNLDDVGNGIAYDPNGYVIITGNTSSKSGISSSVIYQNTIMGAKEAFVTKFTTDGFCCTKPVISGDSCIYPNSAAKYVTIRSSSNKYKWSVTGGIITSASDTSDQLTVLWGKAGTGIIRVTTTNTQNDCYDSASAFVKINSAILPEIIGDTALCFGATATYTIDSAKLNPGSKYNWEISNGTIISGQSSNKVLVNWNKSLKGIVTLTETYNTGCKQETLLNIKIQTKPNAGFSAEPVCNKQATQFINSTTPTQNYQIYYKWKFGDGDSSTLANPTHVYKDPGTYEVTLYSGSSFSCIDSLKKEITVYPLPEIEFTFDDTFCIKEIIKFTNNSTNALRYIWDFGNGGTSSSKEPSTLYTQPGKYLVKLIVLSDFECLDTFSKTITILPSPISDFSIANNCAGDSTYFQWLGKDTVSVTWNFGDGNTSAKLNPAHQYAIPGTYTVTLKVSGKNGCLDSTSKNVIIYAKPKASFKVSSDTLCRGTEISFTNLSDDDYTISWDFGNGMTSKEKNPVYTYSVSGLYEVVLKIQNRNGCIDSFVKPVIILPSINAEFSYERFCDKGEIQFKNESIMGSLYLWDLGDGNTSTQEHPLHKYTNYGDFKVKLTVINSFNCTSTISKNIFVSAPPIATFTAEKDSVSGNERSFIFTPVNLGSVGYNWNMGDSTVFINEKTVKHTYKSDGTYKVLLYVTGQDGCANQFDSTLIIKTSGIEEFKQDNKIDISLFPNPAEEFTVLRYNLPQNAKVKIIIADFTGKEIDIITDSWQEVGTHSFLLNGNSLKRSAGIYFIKLNINGIKSTRKLVLIK